MTEKQLQTLDEKYRERYGKSLRDAIMQEDDLDQSTKDAVDIFLKGRDKIQPEDWDKLITISLGKYDDDLTRMAAGLNHKNVGNVELFKETMAAAPPDVRKKFLDNGGEAVIEKAFSEDSTDALEYAKHGRLSTARMIEKNDCVDDDEDAIEKALKVMPWKTADGKVDPDSERELYRRGRRLQLEYENSLSDDEKLFAKAFGSKRDDLDKLPEHDRKALETYYKINEEIDGPCDDSECTNWRNDAVYPGGEDAILEEINGLSADDWKRMRENPGERQKFIEEHGIDLLTEGTSKKCLKLLDEKLKADNYGDLKYIGGKPLNDYLQWRRVGPSSLPPDAQKLLEGIEKMSMEDQRKYRTDEEFRKQVDVTVALVMNDAQKTAAQHMLESVAQGKYPEGDFIDKINIEAGRSETNEPQVIRYAEEEFTKSLQRGDKPTLHERISNPKTPEDAALRERLLQALDNALEDDEYEKWAKPILENGRLTIEQKMELNSEDGDKKSVFTDIRNLATAEDPAMASERHKLAADEHYRERVLGHLPEDQRQLLESMIKHGEERSQIFKDATYREQVLGTLPHGRRETAEKLLSLVEKDPKIMTDAGYREQLLNAMPRDQRKVAESVLKWGAMRPEDAVQAHVLGLGVTKDEMLTQLKRLTPRENLHFRDEYARKYKEDVVVVLEDKLKGKDEDAVLREIRIDPLTAREALHDVREVVDSSNSGFGAEVTSWWASGAGDMAADKVLELQKKIQDAAARGEELPVDEAMKIAADVYEYAELFEAAKVRTADQLADIILSVATIAVPGGLALRSLLIISAIGGGAKVAMKAAITGDASMADFASGMVDTALSAVGPAQIGKAVGLGRKAATQTAEKIIAKGLIREGEEIAFEKGLRSATAHAIADGSGKLTDKTLDKLVDQVAKKGASNADKAILRQSIKETLEAELKNQVKSGMRKHFTGVALDAGAGFVGGFGGGVVRGAFEWDGEKSVSENMNDLLKGAFMSGAFGAGGGLAFSSVFRAAGGGWRMIRGKDVGAPTHLGDPEMIAREGEFAVFRPKDAPPPKGETIEVTSDALKGSYQRIGDSDYFIDGDGVIFMKMGDGKDGGAKLARDDHASIAVSEKQAANIARTADATTDGSVKAGGGDAVSVSTPKDNALARTYTVGGDEFQLEKRPGQGRWFFGGKGGDLSSPVKVHVMTSGPKDLGELQKVLIPALNKDPELASMIGNWKTFDPNVCVGKIKDGDHVPNGTGETAKGFTIYVKNPADAAKVQAKIDKLLADNGLALEKPLNTGNVGKIAEGSHRVSVVRDAYPVAYSERGAVAYQLDDRLTDAIRTEAGVKPGQRIPDNQLRAIEQKTGLSPNTLAYDKEGNLVLEARLQSRVPDPDDPVAMKRGMYATEEGVPRKHGELTDRPALYALADRYGMDQADLLVTKLDAKTTAVESKPPAETKQPAQTKPAVGEAAPKRPVGAELEVKKAGPHEREMVTHKTADGTEVQLYEAGGWYYPAGRRAGGPIDRGVKLHVFAKGGDDFARLQEVLIPALQKDPELSSMVPQWKTLDPRFRNPDVAKSAGRSADGAVFAISVKDPADVGRVQKRIDEILSQHLELKLEAPPKALNKFAGETNRVGIVRDFWPASKLETEVKLNPAKADQLRESLGKPPGSKFTAGDFDAIERHMGLSLRYDESGNIVAREAGAVVDQGLAAKINQSFGIKTGDKLSAEQLRQVETRSGLKEGSLVYDAGGNLVLKGTPGESLMEQASGGYFLQIAKAERNPRGVEYISTDLRTGETRTVKSEGLTDQPAMYKLSRDYGIEPVDEFLTQKGVKDASDFKVGDQVMVGENKFNVIGIDKDNVLVRPVDAAPPDGKGIPVSADDLKNYERVGNSDYYLGKDGAYYKLRDNGKGGKELVQDWDVESVQPKNAERVSAPEGRGQAADTTAAHVVQEQKSVSGPKGHASADNPRTASDTEIHGGERDTETMKAVDPDGIDAQRKYVNEEDEAYARLTDAQKEAIRTADFAEGERPIVAHWVEQNPMAQAQNVRSFTERLMDTTDRWHDLSSFQTNFDRVLEDLQTAYKNYDEQILSVVGSRAKGGKEELAPAVEKVLKDREALSDLVDNGPSRIPDVAKRLNVDEKQLEEIYQNLKLTAGEREVLRDSLRIQQRFEDAKMDLEDVLAQRQNELQRIADDYATANGLPKVKIVSASDKVMQDAGGFYMDDTITVRASDLLRNSDPAELGRVVYHEMVHNQQHYIMVRKILDDSNPKIELSQMERIQELRALKENGKISDVELKELENLNETLERIRKDITDKTGSGISDERLMNILRVPEGALGEITPLRAKVLMHSFAKSGASRAFADFQRAVNELRALEKEWAEVVAKPDGAHDLIRRLTEDDDGKLSRTLFGTDEPPLEVMALMGRHVAGKLDDIPNHEVGEIVYQKMMEYYRATQAYKDMNFTKYLHGIHETEAAVIDKLAQQEFHKIRAERARKGAEQGKVATAKESRPAKASGANHKDALEDFDLPADRPHDGDGLNEDTGVFRRPEEDVAGEETGVFRRVDDENTVVDHAPNEEDTLVGVGPDQENTIVDAPPDRDNPFDDEPTIVDD
ncbi:MAG TPA: hypothetical protein V6D17_06800 [Candidatus Obscuribacterales bacterium]